MSDTEVGVRITGNASGAVGAFNVSEEAAARALSVMVQHFQKLGLISTEEMAKTGVAAKKGAHEVAESATMIGVATGIMREHFAKAGESAEIMKGHFERVAKGVEFFNAALLGIGAVLAGGALFKESIGAAVSLTTETNRLASTFGLTLEKASGLHETLHTLGIETDTMTGMAMKLTRQIKLKEDALNRDNVATRDATGAHLNLFQIMQNGIDRLREMKPGYERNAVAIDLFGRGAGDLTKLLRLNDDAMREGMETAKALGIVVTKDGVESTVAYQHSVAEAKSVIEALWTAVGQALMPVIKELSEYLKNHGTSAVEAMRGAIEGLINAVRVVVAVFATFDLAISVIAGALAALGQVAYTTGKIIYDALTGNWKAIEADWKSGFDNLKQISHDAAAQIAGDWAAMNIGWTGDGKSAAKGAKGGNEANPDTGDTAGDKPKKAKKAKADPSRMPEFDAQLAERKLALDRINNVENTFREMSKAEEASYWQEILARSDLSVKERAGAEAKYLAASLAAKKQSFEAMIAQQQAEIIADKGHGDARLAMARKIVAEMTAAYGAGSKQAIAAEKEVTRVLQEEGVKQAKAADEAAQSREKAELGIVDAAEAAAKNRVAMGQETAAQLIAQERKFENERYTILKAAIAARIAAAALDPTTSLEKTRQLNALIEAEDRKHQAMLTKIANDGALQRTSRTRTAIDGIASSWGSALAKMATLQASFGDTIKSLWQGIMGVVTGALTSIIEQYIAKWLSSLLIKKAAQVGDSEATIVALAAEAGAGGVASMAAAPYPLDLGAPEFGAAMSGIAMGYSIPSAKGGWDVGPGVGRGIDGIGGMPAIIHPREMILDEPAANNLRAGKGGGDTHIHLHGIVDGDSVKALLHRNSSAVATALAKAVRNGVRP
jgi:hypothetical protein